MTEAARSSCNNPAAAGWLIKNAGSGQFCMVCPIETYISIPRKPADASSRCFRIGVSLSSSNSWLSDVSDAGRLIACALFFFIAL